MAAGKITDTHPAYDRMAQRWALTHDLLDGTECMQANATRWLPKEEKEKPEDYQRRVDRTILFPALEDAIDRVVAMPFSQAIKVSQTMPEQLDAIEHNTDREGRSISEFGEDLYRDGAIHGLSHVITEYPPVSKDILQGQEKAGDVRPYFCHIKASDLFNWEPSVDETGAVRLEWISYYEHREGGNPRDQYIRKITREGWELHHKPYGKTDFTLLREGTHDFGEVPIDTWYARRVGFMEARPPFENLASMNLGHWRSTSYQQAILAFVRLPLLYMFGVTEEEVKKQVTIGPGRVIKSKSPDVKIGYVEPTGVAMKSGADDLEKMEAQMQIAGLQPFLEQSAGVTATARSMDENKHQSKVQAWVTRTEAVLNRSYARAAKLIGTELAEEEVVDIYKDFVFTFRGAEHLQLLFQSAVAGVIQKATYVDSLRRAGAVPQEIDPEEEVDAAAEEHPNILDFPTPPDRNEDRAVG